MNVRERILIPCRSNRTRMLENIGYSPIQAPGDVAANQVLTMHVLQPWELSSSMPAIVWIPGGGWVTSRKDIDIPQLIPYVHFGFTVFAISYRTSGTALFPAQLIDVKTAIRYIRSHAEMWHVDPGRIAAMGQSAGGHLAALMGTTGHLQEFDGTEWAGVSNTVQAVVEFFGPTDLWRLLTDPSSLDWSAGHSFAGCLLGGTLADRLEDAARASPITYVSPHASPFWMAHGEVNDWVSREHSQYLYEALTRVGVTVAYYEIEQAGHGTDESYQPEVVELAADFSTGVM
ncbi:MAG: alpha/beta hydrolase [Firmicutes bacterium]|nr:alpha/beta hydrolase [Bacillota bacterium]